MLGTTQAQSPGPVSYLRAYENKGSEQKGTQTMQNQMNKYVSIYLIMSDFHNSIHY